MFKNPFSFKGRIRRKEYLISFIIQGICQIFLGYMIELYYLQVLNLLYIPIYWFLWAQGAKRSHDIGNSGWWQLIPLYNVYLLFPDGKPFANKYGDNPKEIIFNEI